MRNLVLAGVVGILLAGAPAVAPAQQQRGVDTELVLNSEGFLRAHPDLQNRHRGMEAYEDGRHEEALTYFRRAARYADKPSQAMVGEMLWKGEGGAPDPALAYAWMDLAAERGYPGFTIIRERYWAQLDEARRREAVARGEEIYAEYGDAVAQPHGLGAAPRAQACHRQPDRLRRRAGDPYSGSGRGDAYDQRRPLLRPQVLGSGAVPGLARRGVDGAQGRPGEHWRG